MEEKKLDVNVSEEVAQGNYANLAIITHSNNEFILDFASLMPGFKKANVRSRIIMTPLNAKRLLAALNENIKKFEEINGPISDNHTEPFPIMGGNGGLA